MKKPKNYLIFIVLFVLLNLVIYLLKPGGDLVVQIASDFFPVFCSLIAVIFLIRTQISLKKFDYIKSAWLLILIGIAAFFIAEFIYGLQEIVFNKDMNSNFPGIADFFWCFGYIPLLIGLLRFFFGYKKSGLPMGDFTLYAFIALTVFFFVAIIIYFLLMPILQDTETETAAKIFYVFYPVADMLLVIPTILLIYVSNLSGSSQVTRPIKYLAFGFLFITVADLLYSYLGWMDLYGNGSLIDVAWHLGYLFIGFSAIHQNKLIDSLKEI